MYKTFKHMIAIRDYSLIPFINKVDEAWVNGYLTVEQRDELVNSARENAKAENNYSSPQKQIDRLSEIVLDLRSRVEKLENGGVVPGPGEEYPEYVPPTCAVDAYHNGDKITYSGKKYICIAPEGVAVVWPPDAMPSYWKEVK